jgi:tetratricopeptide (TPR) repeat protein
VLYHRQHKYEQAEQFLQRALLIRERVLGINHTHVAQTLSNLGNLYYDQGKYEQAESLFQRAIAIREQAGVVDPYAAGTIRNLARLYYDQGKHEQAEPLYRRAIDIYEQKLGPKHNTTVKIRKELESLKRKMEA